MLTRRGITGAIAALPLALTIPARARAASSKLLIAQPAFSNGIAPNFHVQGVLGPAAPTGVFFLQSNQTNPFMSNGIFTPVTWDASRYTGLCCPSSKSQLGMYNTLVNAAVGHTVAQLSGGTVGAFINSGDLINGSATNQNGTAGMKQMICPCFNFPASPRLFPFAPGNGGLAVSLDFQVPTATASCLANSSTSYASSDFLLVHKTTGARVSYTAKLFIYGSLPARDGVNFDVPTQSVVIGGQAQFWSRYVTLDPSSALVSCVPWSGMRRFTYAITPKNAAAALADANAAMPGALPSVDPADYYLSTWHGNFETHYTFQQPATLGWSMSNLQVSLI
jgi:hypothetical protein